MKLYQPSTHALSTAHSHLIPMAHSALSDWYEYERTGTVSGNEANTMAKCVARALKCLVGVMV